MARCSQLSFGFYQQSPNALDSNTAFSEDDEMSVLDDKILGPTSTEFPSIPDCRTSYEHAADGSLHRDPEWHSDFPRSISSSHSRQNFQRPQDMFESSVVTRGDVPPAHASFHHVSWSLPGDSGPCTPTALYEQFPADYESSSGAPFPSVSTINIHQMSYPHGLAFSTTGAVGMSPQSSQGWMPGGADMPEGIIPPTKSPTCRNESSFTLRRDGIRKKNARFEIPAERTLSNIDQLISQSTNEEEIKELKQQKRLLRNRQAALDSRQRKKLHTERLEEEKKQYTQLISELEEALQSTKIREAELLREKSEWMTSQQQISQYIDGLLLEKDELIRVHTLETADLRKKNNILKETVEKLERQFKVSGGVVTSVSDELSDFDNLAMDWEDFTIANGFPLESEPTPSQHNRATTLSTTPMASKSADKTSTMAEFPFSWNAFYMCLLFGAFIVSNSGNLSPRSVPQLSEEYRAESANVLKAVLASAPPELAQPSNGQQPFSGSATAALPAIVSGAEMAQMNGDAGGASTLDELHNTLAMPSKEQEHEQAFSLTAEQYNSMTTYMGDDSSMKPQQPSNLQQALASMRAMQQTLQNKATTSEVYSRSLLWDQVPEQVIRDFRRLVQEYGSVPVKEEEL